MSVGVMGCGEVGGSLMKTFPSNWKIKVKDIATTKTDSFKDCTFVHVCFPCNEKSTFVQSVSKVLHHECKQKRVYVIVHSTVPPGTCEDLQRALDFSASVSIFRVVHSPVRGVHPHLSKSLQWFVKYVGCDCNETFEIVQNHLHQCGCREIRRMSSTKATEIAKILSTTYYGVIIAYHAEMKEICEKNAVSYQDVVVDWNNTYNEGYGSPETPADIRKDNVVRPVLDKVQTPIGGHCVVQNSKLLEKTAEGLFCTKYIDKFAK